MRICNRALDTPGEVCPDCGRQHDGAPAVAEQAEPGREPVTYDPALDQCAGGCRRNDSRRVAFGWYGLTFACPGCFEAALGGPPDDDQVITLNPEQIAAGAEL